MPLYEYHCQKCGKRIEKIQRFSDSPLTRCEGCGGKLDRLISAPAIQFKGSGWYVTDYVRKSPASESSGGKGEVASSAEAKKTPEPAPASKSSESKPSSDK